MAKIKTRSKNRKSAKKKTSNAFVKWLKKIFWSFFILFGFLFASYLGYLDYDVRHKFEGRRWALPTKVYANPVEIYAGLELSLSAIESVLKQLRYQHDPRLSSNGTYFKQSNQISFYSRSFTFWDERQAAGKFNIKFSGQAISKITNLLKFTEVAILRIEPLQIGSFYPAHKEDRILIKLTQVPQALIDGLLVIEDREFYSHHGISYKSILRALWANIKAGGVVQGGSTITQQLVKNYFLTPERTVIRKIKEALMAIILEFNFEKDEILEAYLNEIYLGQDGASSIHGFGLASRFYFDQPLKSLKLHQLTALVAMIKGPSEYDPRRNPQKNKKRQNLVLDEMQKLGYINQQTALWAKRQPITVIPHKPRPVNIYPAFIDLVKRQLRQEYRNEYLTSEGLRIFTTLDTLIQNKLEKIIPIQLKQLEKNKSSKLESAVIVTSREGGEIVALSGARNQQSAGFNRALDAVRPIGSLIKPAIYLTALEQATKYTVITLVDDEAVQIKTQHGAYWTPKNYDGKKHGKVPLYEALAKSYNLATVKIGMDVGIARSIKTLKNMGIKRKTNLYPSLLLGALELTPMEVTQMYQTLAGDGFVTPLRSIRAVMSLDNQLLQRYAYNIKQKIDPAATYLTNTILQKAMLEGTGSSAYAYFPKYYNLVGKTGTTNKLRDSWFAGYSGDFLAVAWIGRDDNKPSGLSGGSGALQLWGKLMQQIAKQPVVLLAPENIEQVWIETTTGLRANASCPNAQLFPFIEGSAPAVKSPCTNQQFNHLKGWFDRLLEYNF